MFLTFALYLHWFLGLSIFVVHKDGSPLGFQDLVMMFMLQVIFMSFVGIYTEERDLR